MASPTYVTDEKRIHVLIADAHPSYRRAATGYMEYHQELIVVESTGSIEETLDRTRNLRPAVVILDPSGPAMGGLESITRLRAVSPDVRIIVLSLTDSITFRNASLAMGADEFVSKVWMTADLIPTIRRVVQVDDLHSSVDEGFPAGRDGAELSLREQ